MINWLLAKDLNPTWLGAWLGKGLIIGVRWLMVFVGLALLLGLVLLIVLDT